MQVDSAKLAAEAHAIGVIGRMQQLYGVKTDGALARELSVPPTTVSSWRQRGTVPFATCVDVAIAKETHLDWLIFGIGPQSWKVPAGNAPAAPQEAPDLSLLEGIIKTVLKGMQSRNRVPDPEAFAKFCIALYEFSKDSGAPPAQNAVDRLLETMK
jgi:hypothetical protein